MNRDVQRVVQASAEATALALALELWGTVAVEESYKWNGWDYKLVQRSTRAEMFGEEGMYIHIEISGIDALSASGSGPERVTEKRKRLRDEYPASLPALVLVTDFRRPSIHVEYVA